MIKFSSFKQAVDYRTECPLCSRELHINDRDLATDYGHMFRSGRERLSFFLNASEDDTITIDPETDEVELLLRQRMPEQIWNGQGCPPRHRPNPIYNGIFLHALTIDCKSCCQYNFTIQIHFDLTAKKLAGTFLNSETISIEEGNMVHEIKNVYAFQQTSYTYFPKDGSRKSTILPLIPLDLDNPKETISRIRKLLIFS